MIPQFRDMPSKTFVLLTLLFAVVAAPAGLSGEISGGLPVSLASVLIGLSGMIACIAHAIRQAGGGDEFDIEPIDSIPQGTSPPAKVQFYKLLDTIDDIGRLISMNYELDTLLPAIVSTAEAALNSGRCEVYLWDARQKSLYNPQSGDAHGAQTFVPSAQSGLAAHVIAARRIWTQVSDRDGFAPSIVAENETDAPDAIAPLTAGTELLGLLVVDHVRTFSPQFEQLLHTLANIYGLGIRNAQIYRRAEEQAQRDGLTGLYNHATFQQKLRSHLFEAAELATPLSLMMGDIDFFKRFNDDYGHQTGDEVLRQVAQVWRSVLPDAAVLARYGGEEFIAVLPGFDESGATDLAESLRQRIEGHSFSSDGRELHVTSSFGVAEFEGFDQSPDDFVRITDQCLYASKESGRNCVTSGGGVMC